MSVRVRFAPSPTGMLHVGALRTVLFNQLFARRHGGQLILRIEDTDRGRYDPASEQEFVDTLRWVGIEFDEGPHVGGPHAPYRQSERKELGIYAEWAEFLLANGHAYKAFDTPEEIEEMRLIQQVNKQSTGYFGGRWRDASAADVAAAEGEGRPFVVRQRIPRDRRIVTQDAVRGRVEVDSNLLPDPVLIKSDGMPTYHLAAIVDEHLMEITHVLRGEEWLPSFPQHWLLFEQFGWERPIYAHCPVIVGNDGKKLSKRHGATRVLDYGAMGYTQDALKNFIALIGWSPGDEREVLSEPELIEAFSLEGIQSSPGRFDIEKLRWLNGHRIRQMPPEALLDALLAFADDAYTETYWNGFVDESPMPGKAPIDGHLLYRRLQQIVRLAEADRDYVLAAIREEQPRVHTLADFAEALEFFVVDEPPMDEKAVAKWFGQPHVGLLFEVILTAVERTSISSAPEFEALLKQFQADHGLEKLGPVVHPTRVALTGKTYGPGLFELMAILGPDRIARRIRRAKELL